MAKFIARRILYTIVMIIVMSIFLFGMSRAAGDPRLLYLNEYTTEQDWEAWGKAMGLDRPLYVQYGAWAGNAAKGDLGDSMQHQKPSLSVVYDRLGATLLLAVSATALVFLMAIPLGILSAVKRGTAWDYAGRILALLGQSAPQFWLGIVLIIVFAVWLGLLPVFGRGGWQHYILPSLALAWLSAAGLLRLVRSAMLEVLDSEYVKFARAKGVNYQSIIWRHALKNALIAPLTYSALFIAGFIDGSVVIETVFAWPGVGRLTVEAINANDFPLVTAVITLVTILYVTMALIADVLYAVVDPRIRFT